jgi:Ca2+-binding EF-hand superfamily protein
MKAIHTTALALLVSAVTHTAFGQAPEGGDPFKKFDKNNDGKVTADELPNQQAFERFDKNKDGAITRDEMGGAGKPGAGKGGGQFDALVKAADKNGDGKITKAEAGDAAWFSKLDQNKDDVIDAKEIEQLRKAAGAGAAGTKPAAGAQGGQFGELLKKADKNGDGKVTKEEAGDAPWFDKVDKNSDGVLDAEELEKLREAAGKNPKKTNAE